MIDQLSALNSSSLAVVYIKGSKLEGVSDSSSKHFGVGVGKGEGSHFFGCS
jgi:hypothetical protein